MRKSLLKSIVAATVLGATMAITSVAAYAADKTWVMTDYSTKLNGSNVYADLGDGLEVNSNQWKDEEKSYDGVDYTGCIKLNKKDFTSAPDMKSADAKANALAYDGKAGDVITWVGKGNGIPYTFRVAETADFSNPKDLGSTVDNKANLEEFSYTLKNDGKVYIFAYNQQNAFVYSVSVTKATATEELTYDGVQSTNYGKVVVDKSNKTAYVVAVVSKKEVEGADANALLTLSFGSNNDSTALTTDTVYTSVDGLSANDLGEGLFFAVKVTDLEKDADVEALMNFTYSIA